MIHSMRDIKLTLGIAILCSIWLIPGCIKMQTDRENGTQLARVGTTYLTLEEAREHIPDFATRKDSVQALEVYREQWIQRQVLLNEANSLSLAQQNEVKKRLKEAREDVLITALQKAVISEYSKNQRISDAEARNYYQQNKQQLELNERYVKFRHIETPVLSQAREARNQLENDSSWTNTALDFSLNAEENIEQSKRYWPISVVFNDIPSMKQYASTLDSASISPIQRENGVYHLIQLTDVKEQGESPDPGWFIEKLKGWLMLEKKRKHYNSYTKNLYFRAKENNEIEVFNVNKENANE